MIRFLSIYVYFDYLYQMKWMFSEHKSLCQMAHKHSKIALLWFQMASKIIIYQIIREKYLTRRGSIW